VLCSTRRIATVLYLDTICLNISPAKQTSIYGIVAMVLAIPLGRETPLLLATNCCKTYSSNVQGVLLTGGLSLTTGMRDRLEKELAERHQVRAQKVLAQDMVHTPCFVCVCVCVCVCLCVCVCVCV